MSILHIAGISKDSSAKRLERLLASLDRERVREVTDKVLEGTKSIGERHETIASALEDAAIALSQLRSVETGLERARKAMEVEFDARRDERSEIVALNALLEHVRQELAAGGARETDLQSRLNAVESALAESKAGRSEAEGAATARQAEVIRLSASFSSARGEASEYKTLLEQASKQLTQLQEETNNLRTRADDVEARRQEAENKAGALAQSSALAEAERAAMERRADTQAAEAGRLGRLIAELEGRLAAEQARARGVETTLQNLQADAARLNQAMDEQAANTKVHLETADRRLDTAQARAQRLEEENGELNRRIQEIVARDRILDRDLAETTQRLERSEERVKGLEAEHSAARQELLAAEGGRTAAVERNERLNDSLGGRAAEVKRLEEQADVLQGKVNALEAQLAGEKAAGAERARTLTDMIERERSEHSIAQGALEAARKDRARLHLELLKVARRRPDAEDVAAAFDSDVDEAKAAG